MIDGGTVSGISRPPVREHDIDWGRAVDAVVWVPEALRDAVVPVAAARRMLRCTESSFAQLRDLGLPFADSPDGPRFDALDLQNVALHSRSGVTEVEVGMRLVLGFMQSDAAELTRPRRWRYQLRLATEQEPGARLLRQVYRPMPEVTGGVLESCVGSGSRPPELTGPFVRMAQGAEVVGTMTVQGVEQAVRAEPVRRIFDELLDSGARWQYLPEALAADPPKALALGVGNCATLCAVLEQRLREAGYDATAYHGWMAALNEMGHGWVEVVDDDGAVKWLDPSFALLATANGFGSSGFRSLVTGSVLNRVVPTRAPLGRRLVGDERGDTVVFTCRPDDQAPVRADAARGGRWWRRDRP